MEVIFRTRQLQRNYEESARAIMEWGYDVGRVYVNRIREIRAVRHFHQLHGIPKFRMHPLRGARSSQMSIYLTGRWRLIVSRGDTSQSIIIEEVSNHYDD